MHNLQSYIIGFPLNQSLYHPKASQHSLSKKLAIQIITLGLTLCAVLLPVWPSFSLSNPHILNSVIACIATYIGCSYALHKLARYPGSNPLLNLPGVFLIHIALLSMLFTSFRIEYSRSVLTMGVFILPIATIIQHLIGSQFNKRKRYLVTPFGCFNEIIKDKTNDYQLISVPSFANYDASEIDGIIFDQHSKLDSHWQQYLAQAANLDIPLFDTSQVHESIYGKSPLDYLPEPNSSHLKPHWLYRGSKRLLESALIIITLPLWLPLVAVFAIAIKVESKGPAFFIQKRVGQGGKEFKMVKLRSMCLESEVNGAQFAGEDDPRITKIGRFIRKVRIDEVPQFFNVLKGEMALIGPRPEQKAFVQDFEEKIPLYTLRHVVKPGITGWAQVTHGYADDEESTKEKLAHDFYYVKNLSLWLDIMVVVKTIKTMASGFGAR